MKVRIVQSPTGYISFGGGPLEPWPKAGEIADLPDVIAADLIGAGHAEKIVVAKVTQNVETRPAPKVDEQRADKPRPKAFGKD